MISRQGLTYMSHFPKKKFEDIQELTPRMCVILESFKNDRLVFNVRDPQSLYSFLFLFP